MDKKLEGVKSFDDLFKYYKRKHAADARDENKVSKTMGKDTKFYKPLNTGGEVEVGKGKDYIKDLIK